MHGAKTRALRFAIVFLGCLSFRTSAQEVSPIAFAPGVISAGNVFGGTFSPDGQEFYFFKNVTKGEEDYRIFRSRRVSGTWTRPEVVSLGGNYSDLYPAISPDGRRMVFSSYRPAPGDTSAHPSALLWSVERVGDGWGTPVFMRSVSLFGHYHSQVTFDAGGRLYFERQTWNYHDKVALTSPWNGRTFEAPDTLPAWLYWRGHLPRGTRLLDVTPGRDSTHVVLVVDQIDPATGRRGRPDLWEAYRTKGAWGTAQAIGSAVNTAGAEVFPFFSPDRGTLYLVRNFDEYVSVTLSAPTPAAGSVASVEEYITSLAGAGHFSGTVLVARGTGILFEGAFGITDVRHQVANTPATLFAIASITKPLTGIAARTLAERGVLDLDAPITRWLPDFPSGDRITPALLLTHRSGIPHRVTSPDDEGRPQTPSTMARIASRAPLAFEPGARRLYSSAGYSVLARVMELASGKAYAQLLHDLVLTPAGVTQAVDATERRSASDTPQAHGHFWTPGGPIPAPDEDLSFLVGAGSLWATPRDLFQIVRRVVDGGYGAADAGARDPGGPVLWTGFTNGFQSSVDYNPATDVTIVLISNLLTGATDWIRRDVPRILAGEPVPLPTVPAPTVHPLSEVRRGQIEGAYRVFGNVQTLTFLTPTAALMGGEYLILATGEDSFFAPQDYAEYVVVSDSTRAVTELRNRTAGFAMTRVR